MGRVEIYCSKLTMGFRIRVGTTLTQFGAPRDKHI